ncbi:hypothetical protein ScPMuIL_010422 [Solemya velum]
MEKRTQIHLGSLVGCVFICVLVFSGVCSLDNGLARTPPMGWMAWERFRCNVNCTEDPENCLSEKLIKKMADRMVSLGLLDVGYEYVSIDDCWPTKERDSNGRLVPDPTRFPSGMKALGDYLHSKGLKFGIYEDFGTKTCGGFPGSEFYMSTDANTFAEWGVDMLKFDGCYSNINDMEIGYPTMEFFLNKTGRPILFSCSWPAYTQGIKTDYKLIRENCNMWRNYADIQDSWDSTYGIINHYGINKDGFSAFAGPGGWNDPDELIVGNFGLSYEQERAHMGMWAMMASPLFMSVDLRSIRNQSLALLKNKRLIAINQDPLGTQGRRVWKESDVELWVKPLQTEGSLAIALLNSGNQGTPKRLSLPALSLMLTNPLGYNLTEAFDGASMGSVFPNDTLKFSLNPTGILMMTAVPKVSSANLLMSLIFGQ